jgi:4'-phosphopantetheinyl transferase EntD
MGVHITPVDTRRAVRSDRRPPARRRLRGLERPTVDELGDALRLLARGRVTVGARAVDEGDIDALFPEELAHIARAVPKRRREFASGRVLLRSLLGERGRDVAIGVAADRSPLLPPGIAGSLAHDSAFAVAAVSADPLVRAIGIDVEPVGPVGDDIARAVLRPEEADLDAHLVFTLKEAAYKAWSRLGGDMLDHHDVSVTIDAPAGSIELASGAVGYRAEVLRTGTRLAGAFARAGGRHLALVVVAADDGTDDGRGVTHRAQP